MDSAARSGNREKRVLKIRYPCRKLLAWPFSSVVYIELDLRVSRSSSATAAAIPAAHPPSPTHSFSRHRVSLISDLQVITGGRRL